MSTICGVLLTFLSAGSFDARLSAHDSWARIGPLGYPVLAVGLTSPDAEVRLRCQDLLPSGWRWAAMAVRHPLVLKDLLLFNDHGSPAAGGKVWTPDELWVAWETAARLGMDMRSSPKDDRVIIVFHLQIGREVWPQLVAIRKGQGK